MVSALDSGPPFLDPEIVVERLPWYHPRLTRTRVAVALGVAVLADLVQLVLWPVGWLFFDEVIDVVAMAATSMAIGFHVLLLPTFVLEFLPVTDLLPTWTGCVLAVAAMRQNELRDTPALPIDVTPTRVEKS